MVKLYVNQQYALQTFQHLVNTYINLEPEPNTITH